MSYIDSHGLDFSTCRKKYFQAPTALFVLLTVFVYTALMAVYTEVFRLIRNSYPTMKKNSQKLILEKSKLFQLIVSLNY